MQKPLKIALVYDAIYPYSKGGGERRFYEFGKQLVREGCEVHLYGMNYWGKKRVIQKDGLFLHGLCKARPLYQKDGRRSITQALIFGLSSFKMLKEDFDVIDCCGFPYFSLFPCKLAALLKRKPLFATWHEVWGRDYWRQYLGLLGVVGYAVERIASRLPNKIIAAGAKTERRLRSDLGVTCPVVTIQNGLDMNAMRRIKANKQASDIVYVGRLVEYKNLHMIFEAMAKLKSKGLTITCAIVGPGPLEDGLKNLAAELGIAAQVHWHGAPPASEDVYAIVKSSKIFVLPSHREGFGIVALEALALGIPVLTLEHPENAAKDLIQEGINGHRFNTSEELADQIEAVLRQSEKYRHPALQSAKQFDLPNLCRYLRSQYANGGEVA